MYNSLSDPYLISQYHQDYLTLINFYDNFKRPGTFIRYYNINFSDSDRHSEIKSTFDIYSLSSINFDIYELTPIYNINPVTNATTFIPEKKGQMYDGVSSITIHTIQTPHINDLITFYSPVKSGEIFRVTNIRTSINAYHSEPRLTWYEMDLEIAPIKDTSSLKISKHYVYDLHKEKYYNYTDYNAKTDFIETVNSKISQIRVFYSNIQDLYYADNKIPLISNHTINYFKEVTSTKDNYVRLFDDLERPYGFTEKFPSEIPTYDYTQEAFDMYNLETNEMEEYIWDLEEESNLNTLLTLTKELQLLIDNNPYFTYRPYELTLVSPISTQSIITNLSQAVNPGSPPSVLDSYGRRVIPTLVGYIDDPNPIVSNGTRIWRYRYTTIDGKVSVDWTHTYMVISSGGVTPQTDIVYNDSDNLIDLSKDDMNKIYVINNSQPVRINLPGNLIESDLALWITIHKTGIGILSIYTTEGVKIEDSSFGGYVINDDIHQTWANIGLFLATTTLWKFISTPLGSWSTH
jgi:hypothetical protein